MGLKNRKAKAPSSDASFTEITIGAMLAVVTGIMPLVMRFVRRPLPPELTQIYQAMFPDGYSNDVFSYWKGRFVIAPAIVIVFCCVIDWVMRKRAPDFKAFFKRPPVVISLIYLAFVIISALASPYTYTSWFGTIDRSEGAFIWLAYFTVFFAAMCFVRELHHTKFILCGLIFSSVIMGAIGVSQLIGRDFFGTQLAGWLVTVGTPADGISTIFTIAHGTLFNPNTFGKYTAMLAPILLLGAFAYDGKKIINLLLLLAGGLMLVGVFASNSIGGLVGIATAIGVLAITYICGLIRGRKLVEKGGAFSSKQFALAAGGVAAALALSILFIPPLNSRASVLFNRVANAARAGTDTYIWPNYFFEGNTMTVYHGQNRMVHLTIQRYAESWLTVHDGDEMEVPYTERLVSSDPWDPLFFRYVFDVPGYRVITIDRFPQYFIYYHVADRTPFLLTFRDERIFGLDFAGNFIDLAEDIPAFGFRGRGSWGSARGYIWSRSFPLMPSRTLIGSGPDTFINVFPQHDIVAKQRYFRNPYIIIDKAHNLFIQTWITTGGISAIALFALFGFYIFTTFWSLVKTKNEPTFSYGLRLGLLAGISAFCVSSMATDSTIGSTGVFFVLLGLGYGMNAIAAKQSSLPS